ncbi:MAG: Diadenosine tetraphosphate (Ap4A) hydrolase [Pelagibacterales bacterium]|jgi:ATP adenylyltransferase|nr:Diadenosine tetraphosphate (Ap4A) hydrolase [Pelagibacterales bacterium]|tara:strand:+ start:658 stop:1056 length:399 start_codon:yes stop_codon:yes gene_type:complete
MFSSEEQCIFCNKTNYKVIQSTNYFFIIRDTSYPVTKHHTLIIANRHVSDYFNLTSEEVKNLDKILKKQKNELLQLDEKITGFNIGVNIGKDAGQSIMHCHIHLIPRRRGDVEDPRGGVRGVIPSKQKYSRK